MALSRGMYWFLVVGSRFPVEAGGLEAARGLRIGAAPGPDDGLRALLTLAGMSADDVTLQPIPGSSTHGTSFGLAAAEALAEGLVDGFWANGMGAAVAVAAGSGSVVLDARRDNLIPDGSLLTFPALTARADLLEQQPEAARAAVRAIRRAQRDLAADPTLATKVAEPVFPAYEASLIAGLIERDAPYYDATVSPEMMRGLALHSRLTGRFDAPGEESVARELTDLWQEASGVLGPPASAMFTTTQVLVALD